MAPRNVLVSQSGGPTAVINASLLGVVAACLDNPSQFGAVYAARHGIEGLLREDLLNLSDQPSEELELLRVTPAAGAIGTCRYKVRPEQQEDLNRIVEVLAAHEIGTFFYIGGNDSMDTAHRVGSLAKSQGLDLTCVGIPKTIDNDLGDQDRELMDHTPGYGSVAKYWANLVLAANEENRGSRPADPVLVLQAMGRRIGFIPAAARLADPERKLPLQIYLPESGKTLDDLIPSVQAAVKEWGRALVVVSEGLDVGSLGERRDAFGHVTFSSSQQSVAQIVVNALNDAGLPVPGAARGQVPGTDQRHAMYLASDVDLREAYEVARHAVHLAMEGHTGSMATIERAATTPFAVRYGAAPLERMANSERTFPVEWIAANGTDVTDQFLEYAQPLLGEAMVQVRMERGLPRFAHLRDIPVTRRCPEYVPEAHRKVAE